MIKKVLFSLGIFVLVAASGFGIVKAAKPEKPVYPTVQEVQQMIADAIAPIQAAIDSLGQRLSLVETAVTSNTQEIQNLNSRVTNLESSQNNGSVKLPFDVGIRLEDVSYYSQQNFVYAHITTESSYPYFIQYDGAWHTEDVIASELAYYVEASLPNGSKIGFNYQLPVGGGIDHYIPLPEAYPSGTVIPFEVHALYFGQELIAQSSITIP